MTFNYVTHEEAVGSHSVLSGLSDVIEDQAFYTFSPHHPHDGRLFNP